MKKFLHEVNTTPTAYLAAYELMVSEVDKNYLLNMSYESGAGFIKNFLNAMEQLDLTEMNDTDTDSNDDSSDADGE